MMDGHMLTVPGCPLSCPLDLFKQVTQAVIPGDWAAECERPGAMGLTASSPQSKAVIGLAVVCGGLFLFVFGVRFLSVFFPSFVDVFRDAQRGSQFAVWWRRTRNRRGAEYMPVMDSENANDDVNYPFGKAKVLGYSK